MVDANQSRWRALAASASGRTLAVGARWRQLRDIVLARLPILLWIGAVLLALVATGQLGLVPGVVALLITALLAAIVPAGEGEADGPEAGAGALAGGRPPGGRGEDTGWRLVVDALPDATVALDAQGMVMHHNAAFAQLFSPIGQGRALSSLLRQPELIEAMDRMGPDREPRQVEFVDRVPFERHLSAVLTRPLPAPHGRRSSGLPAMLITFRDLSEQDKLAQMRADFVANASHELRTPLASLKGFVETLQGPARDDATARQRFLALMASQAERMTRLIDDLLSLSRVEMGVHVPPRGIADLEEVAAYVKQTLAPVAAAGKVEIQLVPLGRPARIRGDRDQIVQVVQNLVQNAISYGREGGTVEIAVREEAARGNGVRRFVICVSDDGPGIAPEHLPRLTERFYRANVASSRAKGGTGLGLAIVKHIVLRHRGELDIASKLGKGSTFSVAFDALG